MPRIARDVPWLGREPNGVFHTYWYDREAGRTKRLSHRTREAADAAHLHAAFLIHGVDTYKGRPKRENGATVNDVLDCYWTEHAGDLAAPESVAHSMKHLRSFFGPKAVVSIDIADCRAFLAARVSGTIASAFHRKKCVTPGTVRKDLSVLIAAINHAVKWKRLDQNDVPVLEMPPQPEPRPMWLYKDELQRLFDAAHGRTADFCQIAYYTAARRHSVETLTKFQVSLERNRISLDKPGARKTNKRRPSVPIVAALRPTIERCLRESPTEYLLGHGGDVFQSFEATVKRAGLAMLPEREMRPAGKPTPHALRHSRATHLLQDGVDPWAVAQLLGDRLETVTRVYGHWCGDYLEQALKQAQEIGR